MTSKNEKLVRGSGPKALLTEAESLQLKQCLGDPPDETIILPPLQIDAKETSPPEEMMTTPDSEMLG